MPTESESFGQWLYSLLQGLFPIDLDVLTGMWWESVSAGLLVAFMFFVWRKLTGRGRETDGTALFADVAAAGMLTRFALYVFQQ